MLDTTLIVRLSQTSSVTTGTIFVIVHRKAEFSPHVSVSLPYVYDRYTRRNHNAQLQQTSFTDIYWCGAWGI